MEEGEGHPSTSHTSANSLEDTSADDDDSHQSDTRRSPIHWGPEYTPETSRFDDGSEGDNPFYRDEVWDSLVGVERGDPIFPRRLGGRRDIRRKLKELRINTQKSWQVMLDKTDGEFVLLHEVKSGKNSSSRGERKSKFGWNVVPTKSLVLPIIAQVPLGTPNRVATGAVGLRHSCTYGHVNV